MHQVWISTLYFVATLTLTFSALGGTSFWTWRQRPLSDKRSWRERALDDLQALESANLVTTDPKRFCFRVGEILRGYLKRGCGIDTEDLAMRQLAQVLKHNNVPNHIASQIVHVLRVVDTVNTYKDVSDRETITTLLSISQQIVLLYPPPKIAHPKRGRKN